MRWSWPALALLCLLLPALAQAQVQPFAPPRADDYTERTDLAEAGSLAGAKRVLRFVQVSDAHILDDDAPYPLRQEPLDPYITAFSTSAQRPQDEYTDEVLAGIVRAINAQHARDAVQFVVNTGDNIDNDLENELMRFLDLWDGTVTTTGPVSGLACEPDGQSTGVDDASHDVADACTSLPASLAAAPVALAAAVPWYSAFGNHDTLIQGNVNPNQSFDEVAASSGRHLLTQPEYVAMHFPGLDACSGGAAADDFGHGYGLAGDRLCDDDPDNDGYYSFVRNGVRFVVLDTINDDFASANGFTPATLRTESLAGADVIGGYAEGAIDPAQMAWLRAEVAEHPDQLIVIASHHTVNSMFTNLGDGYCAPGLGCLSDLLVASGYGTGATLTAELSQAPNVAAWIGGHTHRNRIQAKGAEAHGFWNIESSSLIDYPQQARVIELWVTQDGAKGAWVLSNFTHDFAPSREAELTDPQREVGAIGAPGDQDTILWFDVPEGVVLSAMPPPRPLHLVGHVAFHSEGTSAAVNVRVTAAQGVPEGTGDTGEGLDVTYSVSVANAAGPFLVPEGTPMTLAGNGTQAQFVGSFRPTLGTTYAIAVHASGPGVEPATLRLEWVAEPEFPMDCDVLPCGERSKDTPPLAGVALLALAAAVLLRRR